MRECLRCGGCATRDYAYGCEHDFGEPPEPEVVRTAMILDRFEDYTSRCNGFRLKPHEEHRLGTEWVWLADSRGVQARHPTREGAIALWQERYVWGRFVGALFGTLARWAREGAERRTVSTGYAMKEVFSTAKLDALAKQAFADSYQRHVMDLEHQVARQILGQTVTRAVLAPPAEVDLERLRAPRHRPPPDYGWDL